MPLVSIIIDNYNYGRFLRDAIESALKQTHPDVELIVVDDGSTDDSVRIIECYADRVVPVIKENGGQASALNAGFAASKGEVVIFLDSDDFLAPDAAECVAGVLSPHVGKVQYSVRCVDADRRLLNYRYPPPGRSSPSGDVRPLLLQRGSYPSPPTSGNAFPRRVLSALLPIPEEEFRICADAYLVTLSPFYGIVVTLSQTLAYYRVHGSNTWAHALDAAKFRRNIAHDLQKEAIILSAATKFGFTPPAPGLMLRQLQHLSARLASCRLDPSNHPVPTDSPAKLVRHAMATIWRPGEGRPLKRRIVWTLGIILAATMPITAARHLFSWIANPETCPRALLRL